MLNWGLMREPYNWLVVAVTVLLAMFLLRLLIPGQQPALQTTQAV